MTITPYNTPGRTWRIATITFTAPPGLPGLRQSTINTIRTSDTSGPWVGWAFEVDGASLLMISPPGWQAGKAERTGDKVTVYEVSKALAAIAWEYEPAVDHGADRDAFPEPGYVYGEGTRMMAEAGRAELMAEAERRRAANKTTIAAAIAAAGPQAFASPLAVDAEVERDEPPDEPIVPAKRGPGRPRKNP